MKAIHWINRISLIGFVVWTIILIGGLVVEALTEQLIFDHYLSTSFCYALICGYLYHRTRPRPVGAEVGMDA